MSPLLILHKKCNNCKIGREPCGQSYKAPTIVNYDSRVIPDLKIPHIMTLEL